MNWKHSDWGYDWHPKIYGPYDWWHRRSSPLPGTSPVRAMRDRGWGGKGGGRHTKRYADGRQKGRRK